MIRNTLRPLTALALGLAAVSLGQAQDEGGATRTLVYSAKFVCKNVTGPNDATEISRAFGPGVYRTVLNLQNLSRNETRISIRVTEAHGLDSPLPGATGSADRILEPGEAVFVGCAAIHRLLRDTEAAPRRIDGFITVESTRRLSAAAVYSAVTRSPDVVNDGITLDVEHLRARVRLRDGSVVSDE